MLPIGQAASFASAMAAFTAAGVAAIPPLVELVELVESLSFTPPAVEALPVGSVYLVSVVGGVYPKALVTFLCQTNRAGILRNVTPDFYTTQSPSTCGWQCVLGISSRWRITQCICHVSLTNADRAAVHCNIAANLYATQG